MQQAQKYLTPDELVARWSGLVTRGTLANQRSQRRGPPFAKFGVKVLYPLDQLEQWEAKNMHLAANNDNDKTDEK